MRILELIRLAFSRLRTGRLRAALTMLGVIIGVASVVALVGVGQGTTSSITQRLSSLGTNLLTISAAGANGGASSTLTSEDAAAIRAIDGVAGVAPESQTQAVVGADGETTTTSIIGTTADYASVRAYDVWQGSFLTDTSVEQDLRVAVLGATTADDLKLDASSIGSEITIGGLPFRLIGILQPKGGAGFQDPDDQVMVPIGIVSKYFVAGDDVRTIGVSVADQAQMTGGPGRDHDAPAVAPRPRGDRRRRLLDLRPVAAAPDGQRDQRHADAAARGHRLDLADRRRHRDHEHHAGLGPRADPRDRHPQGGRRPAPRHPRPVPDRGAHAVGPRRPDRHRRRASRSRR